MYDGFFAFTSFTVKVEPAAHSVAQNLDAAKVAVNIPVD